MLEFTFFDFFFPQTHPTHYKGVRNQKKIIDLIKTEIYIIE